MIARSYQGALALAVAILLVGCTIGGGSGGAAPDTGRTAAATGARPTTTAPPAALALASPAGAFTIVPPPPTVIALSPLQARQVATVMDFLEAYNSGRLDDAAAQFADDPQAYYYTCDYRAGRDVTARGHAAIKDLLARGIADHDQLAVSRLVPGTRGPVAFGGELARRESDALRARGYPDGIVPEWNGIKALLTADGRHLLSFGTNCDQRPLVPATPAGTP